MCFVALVPTQLVQWRAMRLIQSGAHQTQYDISTSHVMPPSTSNCRHISAAIWLLSFALYSCQWLYSLFERDSTGSPNTTNPSALKHRNDQHSSLLYLEYIPGTAGTNADRSCASMLRDSSCWVIQSNLFQTSCTATDTNTVQKRATIWQQRYACNCW